MPLELLLQLQLEDWVSGLRKCQATYTNSLDISAHQVQATQGATKASYCG